MVAMRATRFLALVLLAISAYPRGTQGRQVVAQIAERQLTIKAREQVQKLLALEHGTTFASMSTWADEHRNRTTASWHYVNLSRGDCTYNARRDCPDGSCVVEAINKQLAVGASDSPSEKRLAALKYVLHFVRDVHQTLRAGYADDRGGNTYQLQTFGRGTDLHALWDAGLIQNPDVSSELLAAKLMASPESATDLNIAHVATSAILASCTGPPPSSRTLKPFRRSK